jgi:hypothetical protein
MEMVTDPEQIGVRDVLLFRGALARSVRVTIVRGCALAGGNLLLAGALRSRVLARASSPVMHRMLGVELIGAIISRRLRCLVRCHVARFLDCEKSQIRDPKRAKSGRSWVGRVNTFNLKAIFSLQPPLTSGRRKRKYRTLV